jgi:hypothetical protein
MRRKDRAAACVGLLLVTLVVALTAAPPSLSPQQLASRGRESPAKIPWRAVPGLGRRGNLESPVVPRVNHGAKAGEKAEMSW